MNDFLSRGEWTQDQVQEMMAASLTREDDQRRPHSPPRRFQGHGRGMPPPRPLRAFCALLGPPTGASGPLCHPLPPFLQTSAGEPASGRGPQATRGGESATGAQRREDGGDGTSPADFRGEGGRSIPEGPGSAGWNPRQRRGSTPAGCHMAGFCAEFIHRLRPSNRHFPEFLKFLSCF